MRADQLNERIVVTPVDDLSPAESEALRADLDRLDGLDAYVVGHVDALDQRRALAWGWVAGVVALMAVGVVIAAAFATSARRQLTTVGQLAANGASETVIRRSLALQGSWTGMLGSIVGIGIGLLVTVAGWPGLEELVGNELPVRRILASDLLVIAATATVAATLAARFPALSAARVPVLTALAGRRPVGALPGWLVPLGVGATVGGLGLLALVAADDGGGDLATLVAVVAAVAVMVGLVCVSPLLIDALGRVSATWRGAKMLAVRSLARQRTRSAAVVSAIAVVMALTTAALTGLAVTRAGDASNEIGNRTVTAELIRPDGETDVGALPAFPTRLAGDLDTLVPGSTRIDVDGVQIPGLSYGGEELWALRGVVATDDLQPFLGLDEMARIALRRDGLVRSSFAPWSEFGSFAAAPGATPIDLSISELTTQEDAVVWSDLVVTADWVAEHGLAVFPSTVLFVSPDPLSSQQRTAVNRLAQEFDPWSTPTAFISVAAENSFEGVDPRSGEIVEPFWTVYQNGSSRDVPWNLIQAIALGLALLVVLAVVAIGLGLAAVESRDESEVLRVVGAPPSTVRRIAAAKTLVMTAGAAVVAVPVGFAVVWVVVAAGRVGSEAHAPVPWLGMGGLVVVVPALAAAATWAGAALTGRFRPVGAAGLRRE